MISARPRVLFALSLLLAPSACGDDTGPLVTATTAVSATATASGSGPTGASTTGESSGSVASTSTDGPPTTGGAPTTGGEPGTGRELCDRYIECVAVTNPGGLLDAQEDFGDDSSCWSGTPDGAELCVTACKTGLEQGHALAPDDPKCYVCLGDQECDIGQGEACMQGGCALSSSHAVGIQPIWDANCIDSCHSGGGLGDPWLRLTNDVAHMNLVDQASIQIPGMRLVAPGDHADSYLWHKLNATHIELGGSGTSMPQGQRSLSDKDLARIAAWIDQGAQP